METKNFKSIAEILYCRGEIEANKVAITFLQSKDKKEEITYGELSNRAKAIAKQLKQKLSFGDRALLLYPPGLEYISTFFGCLYAGVIPVPAYPPDSRNTERLLMIIKDSEAKYALSTSPVIEYVNSLVGKNISNDNRKEGMDCLNNIGWIATDLIDSSSTIVYDTNELTPNDIVFLQYTSGSTGNPKGVILNNENLLDNLEVARESFGFYPDTYMVSWLPPYHDMGLIGGILQPLYSGIGLTSMAPMTFLKNPFIWLEEISKRKEKGGVISGAPDFAYQLCTRKITDDKLELLDLSNWKVAFSGAEPVRENTLIDFNEKFKASNFKPESFFPVYGLAEATLLVSSGKTQVNPKIISVDKEVLKDQIVKVLDKDNNDESLSFVSCGTKEDGHEIRIVDPETLTLSDDLTIGEIWIKSPSVAVGYWGKEDLTEEMFHAFVKDTGEGPFFRTGDLGFMIDENLYISGRHKDLIIIRGKNYYPQDIEHTVQKTHESLRPGCGSAFAIENEDGEALIVVQEVKREFRRKVDVDEVTNAICMAVSKEYQVQVKDVVLIEPSSFPKTTSGKLQRLASKDMYLKNNLQPVKATLVC
ncbi:fatty acyl-AMP ligase [Aquimarina aggregata]|uniref:fatty acyl-AMP ligase n=1 Tax=Aquimarina aggregata TaxID=1642818 RepID=UPI00248F9675|nr:fatty acyl-AMP ligase [Aquimarina aggregata]